MVLAVRQRELYRGPPLLVLAACTVVFLGWHGTGARVGFPVWAGSYLDDLLCLPLVLGLVLAVHRLVGAGSATVLPLGHGLLALLLFSLLFEWVLPRFLGGFTADPWDVAAYTVGWVIFQRGINRPGSA